MTLPRGAAPPALNPLQIRMHRLMHLVHRRQDRVWPLDQVRHRHLELSLRPSRLFCLRLHVRAHERKLAFTSQNSILMGLSGME
jgi:hypothetical protein